MEIGTEHNISASSLYGLHGAISQKIANFIYHCENLKSYISTSVYANNIRSEFYVLKLS
jgi:hypothetical protein